MTVLVSLRIWVVSGDSHLRSTAVIDQDPYSAFAGSSLRKLLLKREADGLIVTGSETDVCVASVLDAVVCNSSDEGHDALRKLYHRRSSEQIETTDADTILSAWD